MSINLNIFHLFHYSIMEPEQQLLGYIYLYFGLDNVRIFHYETQ